MQRQAECKGGRKAGRTKKNNKNQMRFGLMDGSGFRVPLVKAAWPGMPPSAFFTDFRRHLGQSFFISPSNWALRLKLKGASLGRGLLLSVLLSFFFSSSLFLSPAGCLLPADQRILIPAASQLSSMGAGQMEAWTSPMWALRRKYMQIRDCPMPPPTV